MRILKYMPQLLWCEEYSPNTSYTPSRMYTLTHVDGTRHYLTALSEEMPKVQSEKIEIPGRSKMIDLSKALFGAPVYSNRKVIWKIAYVSTSEDGFAYDEIIDYLMYKIHGKRLALRFIATGNVNESIGTNYTPSSANADYYVGDVSIDSWELVNYKTIEVSFSMDAETYKIETNKTISVPTSITTTNQTFTVPEGKVVIAYELYIDNTSANEHKIVIDGETYTFDTNNGAYFSLDGMTFYPGSHSIKRASGTYRTTLYTVEGHL